MTCMACEASLELKKNGIEAECVIQFCKTYKEEPSFSTIRPRNSFKVPKEKEPRKEKCFASVGPARVQQEKEEKSFSCRNDFCLIPKQKFYTEIVRDAHERVCTTQKKDREVEFLKQQIEERKAQKAKELLDDLPSFLH